MANQFHPLTEASFEASFHASFVGCKRRTLPWLEQANPSGQVPWNSTVADFRPERATQMPTTSMIPAQEAAQEDIQKDQCQEDTFERTRAHDLLFEAIGPAHTLDVRKLLNLPIQAPTANMGLKWVDFFLDEQAISKRVPFYLVNPSGKLDAAMILHLNYPGFDCQDPEWEEVADATSLCIKTIMNMGLDKSNSLWIENSWRREDPRRFRGQRYNPIDTYSAALRECHRNFTHWILENACGRVLVAFGATNRKSYDKGMPTFSVRLDNGTKISVTLLYHSKVLKRIIVYCTHPEFVIRAPEQRPRFDQTLEFAASIAGLAQKRR